MFITDIQTVNAIIHFITLIFAYGLVVTLAGSFRARLADRFGDDTGVELGLGVLDPLRHVDIFGFLCYLWFRFGWGKYIPVNMDNIHGRYYKIKRIVAFFGDTLAYIGIALGMVLIFLIMFGYPLLEFALLVMRYSGGVPLHHTFTQLAPEVSSLHLMLIYVYALIIYVCVVFGAISFVINFFHLLMQRIFEHINIDQMSFGLFILRVVALYILFTFMIQPVHTAVLAIINYASWFFAYCLGVLT